MAEKCYAALDLGAESGRVILGKFDGSTITLEEIHRFSNGPVQIFDRMYWDILKLHGEIVAGLSKAALQSREIVSVAADSWGVDFCLIGKNNCLLSNPIHYRDPGVNGMLEKAFRKMPREKIYAETGIQFMAINTAFRLMELIENGYPAVERAEKLLLIGDTINFFLSGVAACEYTNATTSQLLDAKKRNWSKPVIKTLGLPEKLFLPPIMPGTTLGPLVGNVAETAGLSNTQVVAVATHDTPSAIAAIPVTEAGDWAYLSSGTWSLMGVELDDPILTPAAAAADFTNEGGVGGKITFLKNLTGLWIVQELRRQSLREGRDVSFAEMTAKAAQAAPFFGVIDVCHPSFAEPGRMRGKINAYLEATGQPTTDDLGQLVRITLEALAVTYRRVVKNITAVTGKAPQRLHAVGGGIQNSLLNQFSADATGIPFVAGPVEATALGNILMQMKAAGDISTVAEGRCIVSASCAPKTFTPCSTDPWIAAEEKLATIMART